MRRRRRRNVARSAAAMMRVPRNPPLLLLVVVLVGGELLLLGAALRHGHGGRGRGAGRGYLGRGAEARIDRRRVGRREPREGLVSILLRLKPPSERLVRERRRETALFRL